MSGAYHGYGFRNSSHSEWNRIKPDNAFCYVTGLIVSENHHDNILFVSWLYLNQFHVLFVCVTIWVNNADLFKSVPHWETEDDIKFLLSFFVFAFKHLALI